MTPTELVKECALQAGFDRVGIASADPLAEAEQSALERLRSGLLDGMAWITEERVRLSCDPGRLLPGARSIIALAWRHPVVPIPGPRLPKDVGAHGVRPRSPVPSPRSPVTSPSDPSARIARYACGPDYHDLLRPMLRSVVDSIARVVGRRPSVRPFVDSSPLMEKAVAARAGIGWFGKNGCILTRDHGSWVLLAELITDLELDPDAPLDRDCGRCRICLDRCPTGALVAPYVLDARRCISYLTIEHRGAIPLELRGMMGNWVFGCDVCQEVCPHNGPARFENSPAQDVGAHGVRPRGLGIPEAKRDALRSAGPHLPELMSLDDARFRALFQGTPVLRAKRRGFLRNAAVALGSTGDDGSVPVLARALTDPDPLIRSHSAWALGRIGGRRSRVALEGALPLETDNSVRAELLSAYRTLA